LYGARDDYCWGPLACWGKWKGLADRLMDRFELRVSHDTQLLIIRVSGDEASAALATVQFASWLVSLAIVRINRVLARTASFADPLQNLARPGPWLWAVMLGGLAISLFGIAIVDLVGLGMIPLTLEDGIVGAILFA